MFSLLLGLLLTLSSPDSTATLEECLSIGPKQNPAPVETLNEAQQTWIEDQSVSQDTLRTHLSRILQARECYHALSPARVSRPYLGNILETYETEAEIRVALRQFSKAVAAYEAGLSYLDSRSSRNFVGYEVAHATWPRFFNQQKGYLHYLLGNLSASIESYLQALEAAAEPKNRIDLLISLGVLHQRTQDYQSARHYYQRAQRRLQERSLSPESRRDLQAYVSQTQIDLLLEQTLNEEFDTASLKRARSVGRRGYSLAKPGTERHARLASLLSESLGYLGDFEEAYRLNEVARRYARANDDARLHTFALLKLGELHVQTEHWAQADSILQQALAQSEELGDLDYQRRILRSLGRLHELQEHWSNAEFFYQKGVEVVEKYRESLTASQWSMTAFAQWRDVHRGLVRTLLSQDRPRDAFTALDRSRARHLQDLRTQARVSRQLPSEERAQFDSLSQALTDARNRLGRSGLSEEQTAELRNREARLMAARQQLLQLDSTANRLSLDSLSQTLAEQDRALVSYFFDDPWPVYDRSPRSVAFVLTADTLRVQRLPDLTQDSMRTHVEAATPLFADRGVPDANDMHFDLRPLRLLHDAVYAPVVDHLPDDQALTIIPDGPLFHVPPSMLVHSMPGGRFAPGEARYVLHDRPTSLDLAASLRVDTGSSSFDWSQFSPQIAAFGVSDFDTLDAGTSPLRTVLPEGRSDSSVALPSLPGVERELVALGSTVSGVRTALDEEATEQSFRRGANQAGVLHVASHAFVNASSPLQNAILLRTDVSSAHSSSDGVLFLHELQHLQNRIPLVVLSSCNTAKGSLRQGEGMEGLQYAFRAMGAESTVSTLWPVADDASAELMSSFYRHLRSGRSKDEALRQAQLDFLEANPQKASPFFWAPTVLYGSPTPVPLDDPSVFSPWMWWMLGGVVLVALLGAAGRGWSRPFPPPFCHGPQP